MRTVLILFFISGAIHLSASENSVLFIRKNLISILKDEDSMRKVIVSLKDAGSPVAIAYRGMLKACMAEHCFMPNNKLKWFFEGKNDIEKAVTLNPSSAEIRFVRLLVQSNCPSFLFYSGNMSEDKGIILSEFKNGYLSSEVKSIINLTMPTVLKYN